MQPMWNEARRTFYKVRKSPGCVVSPNPGLYSISTVPYSGPCEASTSGSEYPHGYLPNTIISGTPDREMLVPKA